MIDKLHHSAFRPEVKVPGISRRIAANLRGIFHRHQLRRSFSNRQFLLVRDGYIGAGVPVNMEREDKPIIVVKERRLNLVFHVGGCAVEQRPDIGHLERLSILIFSFIGDLPGSQIQVRDRFTFKAGSCRLNV